MAKRQERPNKQRRDYNNSYNPYDFSTDLYAVMDTHQREFAKSIEKTFCTITDSKSGTGKTTIATLKAFEFLKRGYINKIVYVRFIDDRYLQQGFHPGNLEEKEALLYKPFFDALAELNIGEKQFQDLKNMGQIELMTDTAARGRNLKGCFVIGDEMQNAKTIGDIRLVGTRIHMGDQTHTKARFVMIGHSGQQDNKRPELTKEKKLTPFQAYTYHLTKKPFTSYVQLYEDYRGEFSKWMDNIEESLSEL